MVVVYDPEIPKNQELLKKDKNEQNTDTPSLEQKETLVHIKR